MNSKYSQLGQFDDDDEAYVGDYTYPNSVLVSNHHGVCNIVPPLKAPSPAHSPRPSFSTSSATRQFFQNVFHPTPSSTAASFSTLPAVIVADLQNGQIPAFDPDVENDQGWNIISTKRFRGKHGIGESRHPKNAYTAIADEEIDPSDQVTCSVFVPWDPNQQVNTYTMATIPKQEKNTNERTFEDPIPETKERFREIVESVQVAIENNMQPTRISQGSSGSYFCRNSSGKIVGVFKPKNEEPYGRLNPKWTKWIHRHLFPCFFGRSCLIPNLGYLSEAGASFIDRRLGTNIVPYTDVIHLSSPSFHYDYLDRRLSRLPQKIGSFQCFLTDYTDATVFFRNNPYSFSEYQLRNRRSWTAGGCLGRNDDDFDGEEQNQNLLYDIIHPSDEDPFQEDIQSSSSSVNHSIDQTFKWTNQLQKQFRREFEQLVILDYLIRNTDRGLDNWMIKYCPPKPVSGNNTQHQKGHIHVAAIDNGLAFPYKHPDQWRSYPYGWTAMPDALVNTPFSEATRQQFLVLLSDPLWWRDTIRGLRDLFEMDDDFDEKMFQKQIAVLKGQGYTIVRALKNPTAGPIDLVAMQRVVINQDEVVIEYDEKKMQQKNNLARRPLRTQRSTSFDVISTHLPLEHIDPSSSSNKKRSTPKWKKKKKQGISIDLGGGRLFGIRKKKKNKYRAFDSDGDLSDDSSIDSSEEEEPRLKRVTIIMESIETVKSRTYFTCW